MKKVLLGLLPTVIALVLVSPTFASSNLEISPNSNYTNQSLDYSSGQKIYVRISAEINNAKVHTLNVRDNEYKLITSYNLNENNNQFSTSFQAPSTEGYYSLEAKIESDGSLTTAVKTIKVGNPQNANVNVSIHNNVTGQKVLGSDSKSTETEPAAVETKDKGIAFQSSSDTKSDIADNQEITYSQNPTPAPQKKSVFSKIKTFCTKIINLIWPF